MITEEKQQIFNKIDFFLNNKAYYIDRNKPYREGIILYGEPGCGKSHFILQLASKYGLNIYYFNLNTFNNDGEFVKAVMQMNLPGIMLIEDIDCVECAHSRSKKYSSNNKIKDALQNSKTSAEETNTNGVSLSTILNVLDGLLSQDGQIVIITTNHIEQLDPALIRAGRFDTSIKLELLTISDIKDYVEMFYNIKITNVQELGERISIANLAAICNSSYTYDEFKINIKNNNS